MSSLPGTATGRAPATSPIGATPAGPWRPTAAHLAATGGGLALALVAVLLHRPDVLVLATPLLVIAAWGRLARPSGAAEARVLGQQADLVERQAVRIALRVDGAGGAETVGAALRPGPGLRVSPTAVAELVPDGPGGPADGGSTATVAITLEPTRWGLTELDLGTVRLRSAWGAFDAAWAPPEPVRLAVSPEPGAFSADGPIPHPSRLLGIHGSRHRGEGGEFDDIREFRPGDRPRRIHWPTSARTGRLHVRTTYADNDTEVLLLVDAFGDLPSDGARATQPRAGHPGIDDPEPAGSLTRGLRAAASVAAWCTRNGDRVSLRVLGSVSQPVPAGTGRRQLLRVLGALARVQPGTDRSREATRLRLALPPGSLVVVISPLTERLLVDAAVERAEAGYDVVVIDTAPEAIASRDREEAAAVRLLVLERERTIRALAAHGIAVAPWRGPGTLDAVLASLAARGRSAS